MDEEQNGKHMAEERERLPRVGNERSKDTPSLRYILIGGVLTALVVAYIEIGRQVGIAAPIPFLLLFAVGVVSASVWGRGAGLTSATIIAAYIIYAALISFGPPTLTGGPFQVSLGVGLIFFTTVMLGRTRDQNRTLIRSLQQARDELEDRVKERTAELSESHAALEQEMAEREKVEEGLRNSENRFQTLLREVDDVVWASNGDGSEMLYANDACETLYGWPAADLIENPNLWMEVIHPDDQERVQQELGEFYAHGRIEQQYRIVRPDGAVRWVLDRKHLIFDEAGTPTRMGGLLTDITKRIKGEQEILVANERLRYLLTTSPAVIYSAKASGDYAATFISNNITEQLGYTPEDFTEDPTFWGSHIHPEDAPRVFEDLTHLEEEGHYVHEYRFQHGDGSYRWMRDELKLVRDAAGRPVEVVGYWIDITERKQAEQEIRSNAERFERWKASNFIGILQSNARGDIIDANDTLLAMLGYTKQDLVEGNLDWTTLTPPEFLHLDKTAIEEAADKGYWTPFEKEYFHKDGHRVPIIIGGSIFKEDPGEYIVFIIDITVRKQAEIDLKESEERYRELYEEVESARQRLERLSRQLVESQEQERRRVALELHDEIGQLLTAIKLSLDTTDLSAPQAAQAKLESAKELTNELASKVRDLSLRLRPAMLDDLGLLPTLLWYVKWYTSQNHIQVDLQQAGLSKQRFPAEIETAAYRVIQEALTNVARHAGVESVSVRVHTLGETLHIKVEDAGSGFDPEAVLSAHETSGLSGLRERAGLVGGEVKIVSAPGKGTTIGVILPLGVAQRP